MSKAARKVTMKKYTEEERKQRDDEINEQFASQPASVNTESVDDIIRFLNNNVIGHVEEETAIVLRGDDIEEQPSVKKQKAALDKLVSPQPASKPPRLSRDSVPRMGEMNTFQVEEEQEQEPVRGLLNDELEAPNPEAVVVLEEFDNVRDAFLNQLNRILDNRVNSVLDEVMKNVAEEAKQRRLRAIYKSLTGIDLLETLDTETLQERVNIQLNTNVTWLKTRMNNYILQYFEFAVPKINDIIQALKQFPAAFFVNPDQYDFDISGRGTRTLNFKQITFFVCYIALLCIIIFLYLITGLIKFINDVDTMLGITIEILTENEDIRNLRNEYRARACMTGLGLIEYTLRCINVNHILKLMFSKVGIIPTIAIMCICIYVFRSQSPFFNWIYVLFFKVLRIIIQTFPAADTTAEITKKTVIVFIDTQIYGIDQVAYESSPQRVRDVVDTAIYVSNTTSILVSDAKEFVNNTMDLVPLLCANLTEQVVNANYTDLSIRAASGTVGVINSGIEETAEIVSKNVGDSVVGASNLMVDIGTTALDHGLGALYAGMTIIQDYSIYWGSLVIDKEETDVDEDITKDEIISRLREDTQTDNIFQDEAAMWLSVFHETALAGDFLLHSQDLNKEHTPFISDKFSKIPNPIIANQITVNPRSLITQTLADENLLKAEHDEQNVIVDNAKSDIMRFGTSTDNDHEERNDQIAVIEDKNSTIKAKDVLDKSQFIDDIDFNSIIIPLIKDRYGEEPVRECSLEKVPIDPPQNNVAKEIIHYAGSMVLKIMLPEITIEELQTDLANARAAINNIYTDTKIVVKKTILHAHDTSSYVLTMKQGELRDQLIARAKAIKSATKDTVSQTLTEYNGIVKVAVVVVAGTTILYVAPAAVGLAATILPPLYTTSMAGLQLVGSMGYYGGRAVGYGSYVAVNNVFYPTARAAVYMLSRLLGSFVGNTIRMNPDTRVLTVTNEFTNFIFGNGAMWLPLDQSIGPALQTVSEHSAMVVRGVSEVGEVLTPFVRHNVKELASLIYHNPNTVGAFATLTAAATSSAAVANAIIEAKKNPESNTSHLRGIENKTTSEDIILLNTPQNSPRSSGVDNLMERWFNGLSEQERNQLNAEYDNRQLTQGEKDAEDFKEEYRQYSIGRKGISGKIITKEDIDRDRQLDKLTYMSVMKDRMDKEGVGMKIDETIIDRQRQPMNSKERARISEEEKGAAAADEGFLGRVSKSVSGMFGRGGSKKKRKGSAKKSTRKHNKKSGKKGKSHKRKGSNKKRRHTRR
jgi:hypothetical protein